MPSLKPHGQMSEAFITALFLSVSGGLQDVYTYLYRGKVFANAQTSFVLLACAIVIELVVLSLVRARMGHTGKEEVTKS